MKLINSVPSHTTHITFCKYSSMIDSDNTIKDNNSAPKLILLDIYETILDMGEIQKRVNLLMRSKRGYTLWFEIFMQYSFVDNCTAQFHDFPSIADATLRMTSQMLDGTIERSDVEVILKLMEHLPIKEGVQKGLSDLHNQGFRIAALTNSPETIVRNRMERTGLVSYFEKLFSAEQVGKYKPAIEVYHWAADKVNLPTNEILLVSAHGWDIAGAKNAGMATAYVRQERQLLYPLAPKPDFVCKNLIDLSSQLRVFSTS